MIFKPRKYRRASAIAAASLLATTVLSACGSAPRDTFDLSVNTVATDINAKHKKIQLLIAKPSAVKALDGQDIVIREGESIAYLKQAQWSDRLPDLIQARLVQAFDNSNRFGGVGRPGDGLAVNYQILTDIRAFDVKVSGARRIATVEIGVKIMDDRNGSIKATRVFTAQSSVTGTGNDQYARALNTAFETMTMDIVNWTISSI